VWVQIRDYALSLLIGLLLGAVHFTRTPQIFEAKSDVLLNPRQAQIIDDQGVISNLNPDDATIETESEVLRSVALARRTVLRHGLTDDPLLLDPETIARLRAAGDAGANSLTQKALNALRSKTTVSRKGLTHIVEIKVESESAEHAAKLANAIVETYMAGQITLKNEATQSATAWLQSRLGDLREEVVAAEAAVENYRAERELARAGGMTLNERQLIELNQSLARAEAERTVKEARLAELVRGGRGALPSDRATEALNSDVIARLRDQQAEVTRRKAELASRYGERHPLMIQVNQEIADINAQISDELRRIRANLEDEVRVAAATEQSIRRALARLEQTSAANEIDLVRLRDLEREAEASRIIYQAFLERSKELTDQQSILQADVSVLSQAMPPLSPSAPVLWRVLAVSLGGSLIVGVGLAVLREVSYGGVTTNDQLEKHTGLNHLASIPKLKRPTGRYAGVASSLSAPDFIVEKPQSTFSEAFGRLQLMIAAAADTGSIPRVQRIMFTSAAPGEGKSTTALAYARSCALSDVKTVLVDCDLRCRIRAARRFRPGHRAAPAPAL
ncbi:MAG: exopolysaccharide transport family protein, partial [Pseudomonadota bacterium]